MDWWRRRRAGPLPQPPADTEVPITAPKAGTVPPGVIENAMPGRDRRLVMGEAQSEEIPCAVSYRQWFGGLAVDDVALARRRPVNRAL